MKSKAEQIRTLWREGVSIRRIARRLVVKEKYVYEALRQGALQDKRMAARAEMRKSVALPELGEPVGNIHNHYSTWEARHKPPIGTCVAWVVEDGKARQCGKPAKRQLCPDCQHKTLPMANSLGRRAIS